MVALEAEEMEAIVSSLDMAGTNVSSVGAEVEKGPPITTPPIPIPPTPIPPTPTPPTPTPQTPTPQTYNDTYYTRVPERSSTLLTFTNLVEKL